jgi:hypothetical protein
MRIYLSWLICWVALATIISSCSKDKVVPTKTVTDNQVVLGLYQYGTDSGKRVFIPVTKVGTQTVNYFSVFDTGSSGMTIDATGILPASMITSTGLQVTGDSVVVNGITVTSRTGTLSYGNRTALTKEYGNLAYATLTIGDQNGKLNSTRVPMFIYYKVTQSANGDTEKPITVNHGLDIFGVGPGTSFASSAIASPLTYFNNTSGVTSGFRLAVLKSNSFGSSGTYVASLLTIGLTQADLSSSGFIMHPLSRGSSGGYSPNIPATISYSGQTISAQVLFDSGTPLISTIENRLAVNATGQLPANTVVTITTNQGFTYTYTTTNTTNLTAVENPNNTGDTRTIFGIDFFIANEYLTDYKNHQIGLKNN